MRSHKNLVRVFKDRPSGWFFECTRCHGGNQYTDWERALDRGNRHALIHEMLGFRFNPLK